MTIIKIDTENFFPENLNNLVDSLSPLADNELEILERVVNILLTERMFCPKIINDFVMKQLESTDYEALLQ